MVSPLYEADIPALIRRRRAQILVHSFIYYVLNDSIVSDHVWQEWADELESLQAWSPGPVGFYDDAFSDWDGATGCHLPRDSWVAGKAIQILRIEENAKRIQLQRMDGSDEAVPGGGG